MKIIKGDANGKGMKIGIVVSRFHEEITKRLLDGAMNGLEKAGVSQKNVFVVSVPGAFEIPGALQTLIRSRRLDAVVALGAVIKGETAHFNYVSSAAQEGILKVGLETGVPVTFGVLTTDTFDQAIERSGGGWGNKGRECATDAVEMANLYRKLK